MLPTQMRLGTSFDKCWAKFEKHDEECNRDGERAIVCARACIYSCVHIAWKLKIIIFKNSSWHGPSNWHIRVTWHIFAWPLQRVISLHPWITQEHGDDAAVNSRPYTLLPHRHTTTCILSWDEDCPFKNDFKLHSIEWRRFTGAAAMQLTGGTISEAMAARNPA